MAWFFALMGRVDSAVGTLYRVSRLPVLLAAATILSACVLHVGLIFTPFYAGLWGNAAPHVAAVFQLSSLGIYVLVYVHANFGLSAGETRAQDRRFAWMALDGVPLLFIFVALLFGTLALPIEFAGILGFVLTGCFAVWFRLIRRLRLGYEESPSLSDAVALGG